MDVNLAEVLAQRPSFVDVEPEESGNINARQALRSKLLNPESGLTDHNFGFAALLADIYSKKANFGRFMANAQFRKMPIAYRAAKYLRLLCSDLTAISAGEFGQRYATWRSGPVSQLKPKLVRTLDLANKNLALAMWGSVWSRVRSFYPVLLAAELIDVAHVRGEWLQGYQNDGAGAAGHVAVTLTFVADTTWLAVTMICELAEVSSARLRTQLRATVQWVHGQWTPADGVECTKNLFRWYRSEKVVHFLIQNGYTDLMTYVEFVGTMKTSNAGVESRFSEFTARKNASTTTAQDRRCEDMIITKQLPAFGPDPATTKHTCAIDGLACLKANLPL